MRNLLNVRRFLFVVVFMLLGSLAHAEPSQIENLLYQDKISLVSQQIGLLKERLIQSESELSKIQQHHEVQQKSLSVDQVNKSFYNQAALDVEVAKSNLDSIAIELSESQQTVTRLEKDAQEIENQLNVYNIFSGKTVRSGTPDVSSLTLELDYKSRLVQLEKTRVEYLQKLQIIATNVLQAYKAKLTYVESLLKSQTMMRLKEQQAKSEIRFQQQQSYWLQELNTLYDQMSKLEQGKEKNLSAYFKLENEIFYANENANLTYSLMLIARYQDQLQQLRLLITHGNSITLLNKVSEQIVLLDKQLLRVKELLTARAAILKKRKEFLSQMPGGEFYVTGLDHVNQQYQVANQRVSRLNQDLIEFRTTLEQALKQELSSRQGLPGFSTKAWVDLGAELLFVPSLAFQVVKSLAFNMVKAASEMSIGWWLLLLSAEFVWIGVFYFFSIFLARIVAGVPDHEYGHINLKWLLIKVTHRCLVDIAIISNLAWLFRFCEIPVQNFSFLIQLGLVWLFFKTLLVSARLCLVESVHDRAGHDVRLYHRLKWAFIVGGVLTALTTFIHQLPFIFEVKDLFDRFFLLFMLVVSIFLLRSWEILPSLIMPHIDQRHAYVKRIVRLLGLLVPLILFVNSAIGLFGYVNLVLTISWYQSIFLMVLIGYLFLRGLLIDAMEWLSSILIRHVSNGWLWTEAVLKPLDKVVRLIFFLTAWAVLFLAYGWDSKSPVVTRLNKLLNYELVEMLNTTITPLAILELFIIVSFLYWAARWTREFVYRLLLSRTKDLGIRTSVAILSQYTMVLIGVFICLRVLGIDFKALTVVAGALAFGVGLGLRDLANNFVCGFLLLIERPLRVGDMVTLSTYEGEVMHIGGRAVTIRTWDHMEVLVPNAEIFSKTFINWTAKDDVIRTVINIKISPHDRPEDVQRVVHEILDAHKDVLSDPAPEVFMKELTDGLIEFEVRYYINVRHVVSRMSVRSEILIAIWDTFEKHGIRPAYPHHEILMKGFQQALE